MAKARQPTSEHDLAAWRAQPSRVMRHEARNDQGGDSVVPGTTDVGWDDLFEALEAFDDDLKIQRNQPMLGEMPAIDLESRSLGSWQTN